MRTVEKRTVEMDFDNAKFGKGVKESVKDLDDLKAGLDLDESAKSLSNLGEVSKSFKLGGISEGVQNVSSKFSALGVIGFTVLQNLTNAAIDYGKKLVNAMINPMKMGFSEYETQMNAIQTVLANTKSKGTTLDDVNGALALLNTYADKTIYNFTEMTRNIGTFTAAGVDLDTSVQAIKGIANLAAVSGSNSQQASTAMYQLSQALSSGTVKLQDWNSVVNAGMGGQVFQDALMETARVHDVAIDQMVEQENGFRNTLQNGWLTSEILTETLSKFTGDLSEQQLLTMGYTSDQIAGILELGQTANDAATKVKTFSQLKETLQEAVQSGWTRSWELIIGDFEEAKGFFTEVSDTLGALIGASADSRNKILEDWKQIGGRTFLIVAIRNAFDGVLSIIAPVKEAFKDIFPKSLTGVDLAVISANLASLTEKLKIGGETADKIKRTFKGFFAILDIGRMGVVSLLGLFSGLSSVILPAGSSLLNFTANMGDFLVGIRDAIKEGAIFDKGIANIKSTILNVKNVISSFGLNIRQQFTGVGEWFTEMFSGVDTSGIDSFFDRIQIRFAPLETLAKGVGAAMGGLMSIGKKLAPIFFQIASAIGEFVMSFGSSLAEGMGDINFEGLFDTINSGLIAALLLSIRQFMKSGSGLLDEAGGIFGGIAETLDGVRGSLEAWQQNLKAKTLLMIAGAIAILTISLISLSMIDSKKLTTALTALTGMFVQLLASFAAFSKLGGGGVASGAGLMLISAAILIMATAVSKLAKLDKEAMNRSIGTIYALIAGLLVFSKVMSTNTGGILKGSLGLVAFSVSLLILVEVVKKLGNIEPEALTRGLLGIAALLVEIALFMKVVNLDQMGVSKGLGILILAGSILVMAVAVEKFGAMDVAKLQQGLIAMGAILAELALFTKLSGNGTGIIATALGMTIFGAAMLIFVEAISRMGDMSWDEMGKGLAGMAGALLIVVAAVKLMPKDMLLTGVALAVVAGSLVILAEALGNMGGMTWDEIARGLVALAGSMAILAVGLYAMSGTLLGSAALLVAAGALRVLAPVLTTLGSMPLGEIVIALLALAGMFLVLAVAGYVLAPITPVLLGLGAAILLLGLGAALVGAGLMLFSAGLAALAVTGTAGAVAVVAIVSVLLGILPLVMQSLGDALILFAQLIIKATPVVMLAIKTLFLAFLQMIIDVTPTLLEALTVLLLGLIQLIIDVVPDFVDAAILLLTEMLKSIALQMPDFIQAGFDILLAFLQGVLDNIPEIVPVVISIVTTFIDTVAEQIPDVIDSGINLIVQFIQGLADGISQNSDAMNSAIGSLVSAIIKGFTDGLLSGTGSVITAIGNLAGSAIDALKTLLGIFSPSKVFHKLGTFTTMGFVGGLLALAKKVAPAARELGSRAVTGMKDALGRIKDSVSGNIDMNPTIRPVLDLTEVVSGGKAIEDALGQKAISLMPGEVKTKEAVIHESNSNKGEGSSGGDLNFTQINNSPKALDRIEIYRRTKNQLRVAKRMVTI